MLHLKIGYTKSFIVDKPSHTTIKVLQVGKTDYYVESRLVNKPTMSEVLKQSFINRVYHIKDGKITVGQMLDSKTFKASIYYDNKH